MLPSFTGGHRLCTTCARQLPAGGWGAVQAGPVPVAWCATVPLGGATASPYPYSEIRTAPARRAGRRGGFAVMSASRLDERAAAWVGDNGSAVGAVRRCG